jgi:hypothetical protein
MTAKTGNRTGMEDLISVNPVQALTYGFYLATMEMKELPAQLNKKYSVFTVTPEKQDILKDYIVQIVNRYFHQGLKGFTKNVRLSAFQDWMRVE